MATSGCVLRRRVMKRDAPDSLTATARGIVISR